MERTIAGRYAWSVAPEQGVRVPTNTVAKEVMSES
jgi:hypothetical protein